MKVQPQDDNWLIGNGCSSVYDDPCGYTTGTVKTFHGIVAVYSQEPDPVTVVEIVINGRCYRRTIEKSYSHRGLVTLAKRFAHEVAFNAKEPA